mgnify:CR=1 FL=1
MEIEFYSHVMHIVSEVEGEKNNDLDFFDIFFLIILIYNIFHCFIKGFSLSVISFMKWILSAVITIILVPRFQTTVSEYIESEFINNVGLGVIIFILSLFTIILIWSST